MKKYLHSRFRHSNPYHIKYSQNFIKTKSIASNTVRLFDISRDHTLIEIGPGKGILTEFLLESSNKIIAVEKDYKLYQELKNKLQDHKNLEVINQDFLEYQLPRNNYQVIGNIPFALTSDIFRKLLNATNPPSITSLIVQREAALRLIGEPESLLSLSYKPWFESRIISNLNRNDFQPIPSVDVVALEIRKRDPPLISLELREEYVKFMNLCFTSWQIDIKHSLRKLFTYKQIFAISKKLKINLNRKPSQVNFEEWIILFNTFDKYVSQDKKSLIL